MLISSIKTNNDPCFRTVVIDDVRLEMGIDCGAVVSAISKKMFEEVYQEVGCDQWQSSSGRRADSSASCQLSLILVQVVDDVKSKYANVFGISLFTPIMLCFGQI